MSCIGRFFIEPEQTCVSGEQLQASPSAGVEDVTREQLHETQVGSWAAAHYQPCTSKPQPGRVCVPGGFFFMGTAEPTGLDPDEYAESWPPQPVHL